MLHPKLQMTSGSFWDIIHVLGEAYKSGRWVTINEVAKKANLPPARARIYLYRLVSHRLVGLGYAPSKHGRNRNLYGLIDGEKTRAILEMHDLFCGD